MRLIRFLLPCTFVLLLCPIAALSVSPLFFHTQAVVDMEADVEGISFLEAQEVDTNRLMLRKPEAESVQTIRVQKIRLRVAKLLHLEKKSPNVPGLEEGQTVEVTNPFEDQEPPFKTGDCIRVRIRLVQPHERFVPLDPEQLWWFAPKEEPESINAPRHPFEGVLILKDRF